jgi:hypothetical protein
MKIEDQETVVFADARPGLAYLVRDRLVEAGIEAWIENEALGQGPTGLLPAIIGPRVAVAESDVKAAQDIVREFLDEATHVAVDEANGASPGSANSDRSTVRAMPAGSPVICPDCRRPRLTVCPFCQTASATFPLADRPPGSAECSPGLLLCTTCDEPFEPTYLRRCEWCGHDFGDGFEFARKPSSAKLNDRVITVVIALAAALVAIFAYFTLLLR